MKKVIMLILSCAMPLWGMAQDVDAAIREVYAYNSSKKCFFRHFDVGVTVGTSGFGVDFTTQLASWAQLRLGGTLTPVSYPEDKLDVWRPLGLKKDDSVLRLLNSVTGKAPENSVNMLGEFDMQNIKLLVDFFPLKKNRNFHVTLGAYWGPHHLGSFFNTSESFNTLSYIRAYNMIYNNAQRGEFLDFSQLNVSLPQEVKNMLNEKLFPRIREAGDMTIPVGTYSHDIYDTDGNIIYRKGEYVMLRPDENDVVSMDVNTNSLKPYIGIGYTLPLTKDKKATVSLDAGIMLWGGVPSVETNVVEKKEDGSERKTNISLLDDVDHLPGKLGNYLRRFKSLPVFPEISLRFSQRLW